MSLNNMEEVGTSLPHVKSREMQVFEEKNDANLQQKFNTSTYSVSECHIQIHYRCTFLPSYQLYYFVEKKSKCTCINFTPTGLVDLSSNVVNVLISDIKEHLVEIETINNLLREENQQLRGENIQNKNNLKIEKTNNANNVKVLETMGPLQAPL